MFSSIGGMFKSSSKDSLKSAKKKAKEDAEFDTMNKNNYDSAAKAERKRSSALRAAQ